MCRDQDERYRKPDPSAPDCSPERPFGQGERDHQSLECDAAHLVIIVQFGNALWSCRDVYHFNSLGLRSGFPVRGKHFLLRSGTDVPNLLSQVSKRDSP
jgi:hypothetical protein